MPPQKETKIVLCSMIRNESRVIRRMLNSVKDICSDFVITDTGSTDNTVQICKDFGCTVFINPFENFGKSRSKSIENATVFIRSHPEKYDPAKTFMLLLDADMILQVRPQFLQERENKTLLQNKQCLLLRQTDDASSYYNIRMIRADTDWHVVGNTHEHTTTKQKGLEIPRERYDGLAIDDKNDGGFKFDKLERDLRLLLQGLYSCDGEHVRYLFYISQTYMTLGKRSEAKKFLTLRINHPARGYDEEIFLSYLRRGRMQSKEHKMLRDYDAAFAFMPDRIESMIKKAEYLYSKERYQECWDTALARIINKPMPKHRSLFLDMPSYYDLRDKLIVQVYMKKVDNIMLSLIDLSERANRLNVSSMLPHFTRPIPFLNLKNPSKIPFPFPSTGNFNDPLVPFHSTPSISCPDGNYLAVRYHNYYINPDGSYGCDDRPVKTKTIFYEYNQEKECYDSSSMKLIDFDRGEWKDSNIQGDEDVRLFYSSSDKDKKRLVFTAVNCDSNPNNPRIATGFIDITTNTGKASSYSFYDNLGVQKNWLYCAQKDEFWSCINNKGQVRTSIDLEKEKEKENNGFNPLFRFSAGPLPTSSSSSDEFIVLIHCVEGDQPIKARVYYHRFVLIKNMQVVSYSDAFHFEESRQVEYSCGMGFLPGTQFNLVLITYSVRDKTSQWGILQLKDMIRMAKQWEFNGDHYKKQKIVDGIL